MTQVAFTLGYTVLAVLSAVLSAVIVVSMSGLLILEIISY